MHIAIESDTKSIAFSFAGVVIRWRPDILKLKNMNERKSQTFINREVKVPSNHDEILLMPPSISKSALVAFEKIFLQSTKAFFRKVLNLKAV